MNRVGNKFYRVLQGMDNPQDGTIGWRDYDIFEDRKAALEAARGLKISQVQECSLIAAFRDGELTHGRET